MLGRTPALDITSTEFKKLKAAKKVLVSGFAIEEKYDVLLANYEEFEKEILNVTLESMLRPHGKYGDFRCYRAKLNQRLINLLATSRLYLDSIERHVSDITTDKDQAKEKVNSLRSGRYDKYFEYRFMEELRNHAQHRGFPIHHSSYNSCLTNVDDPKTKFTFTVDFASEKVFLEEDVKFKKSILNKLDEKIDLKQATRKYIECLSEIHAGVRELVLGKLSEMRDLIMSYRNKFTLEVEDNNVGLYAIAISDSLEVIAKVPMLLDWDDVRIELLQKNDAPITNLARRYVSGE